jgi:plastocyanin
VTPRNRTLLIGAGAIAAGGVLAALLLATGTVGDDDDDRDTTGRGEQNEFVAEEDNTIVAEGRAFTPDELTVKVGEAVAFENRDDVAHTFTADDGLFDSRAIEPGGHYGYTVPRAGELTYHCEIHPQMTGTITVEE